MAVTRHDSELIRAYSILGSASLVPRGFTRVGIIDGTSTLGGLDYKRYTTAQEAIDDQVASNLSIQARDDVVAVFLQIRNGGEVYVIKYDSSGGGVPSDALTTIKDENIPVVVLTLTERDDVSIVELSTANAALIGSQTERGFVFCAQSKDATLKTGALPAGLAALAGHPFTPLYFHDDDLQPLTTGHAAYRAAFDPDTSAAAWNGAVRGVDPLASLTTTEYANLTNLKVNFPAQFGTELWVSPATNLEGRPIEVLITALWMEARINELAVQAVLDASARGEMIPVSIEGQILFEATAVRPVYEVASALGRILGIGADPDTFINRPAITSGDLTALRVPLEGGVKPVGGARAFTMPIFFSNI